MSGLRGLSILLLCLTFLLSWPAPAQDTDPNRPESPKRRRRSRSNYRVS
jgi:hypothetical protein